MNAYDLYAEVGQHCDPTFVESEGSDSLRVDFGNISMWINLFGDEPSAEGTVPKRFKADLVKFLDSKGIEHEHVSWV